MTVVAPAAPTTAGIPYSRATTAAWLRIPPVSVTRAEMDPKLRACLSGEAALAPSRPRALGPTTLLAVLIDLKARREETWLIERFPEYALYRARTPRRFVPWPY
jgi:hypothetical protein